MTIYQNTGVRTFSHNPFVHMSDDKVVRRPSVLIHKIISATITLPHIGWKENDLIFMWRHSGMLRYTLCIRVLHMQGEKRDGSKSEEVAKILVYLIVRYYWVA